MGTARLIGRDKGEGGTGSDMRIMFGKHAGERIGDCPSDYLINLILMSNRDQRRGKPWETNTFKVPFEVEQEIRKELHERGYKVRGERWIKEG